MKGLTRHFSNDTRELILKVLNLAIFTIFDHFRNILHPRNRETTANLKPAESEIFFLSIFDQSMIFIPVYRTSLFILTKLEFL